jgi:hypothetical protein
MADTFLFLVHRRVTTQRTDISFMQHILPWTTVLQQKTILTVPQQVNNSSHFMAPKVHYRVHMSPPLVPVLSHMNPANALTSYILAPFHNPPVYAKVFQVVSFLQISLSKHCKKPSFSYTCHMPSPSHHP